MKRPSSDANGFTIVLMVVLLGLFLTLTAFAIDAGNLYLWQLRIDKAARAGAIAALGQRGLQGWQWAKDPANHSTFQGIVKSTVDNNFAAYGVGPTKTDTPNPEFQFQYVPSTDTSTVTITRPIPTILAGRIGVLLGYNTITLTSTQTAQMNRANVALLLDVSGSMLCPKVGTCECRLDNSCDPQTTKLAVLQAAITNQFVPFFNPGRDRITVIPFNTAAVRSFPFVSNGAAPPFGTKLDSFNSAVSNLNNLAAGNTNPCDALAETIKEFQELSNFLYPSTPDEEGQRQLQPFVILFTDGAPNAFRGIFESSLVNRSAFYTYDANSRTFNEGGDTDDYEYDMYNYAIEYANLESPGQAYRGPAPLVLRTFNALNQPTLFGFNMQAGHPVPNGSVTCEKPYEDPWRMSATLSIGDSTFINESVGGSTYKGCLAGTGFNFSIPYTNGAAKVTNVPFSVDTAGSPAEGWMDPNWQWKFAASPTAPILRLSKFDELPYYCAVEAADYLRRTFGATIFTIGLGPSSPAYSDLTPAAGDCKDPLQDADDHLSRKDYFLARLAVSRQIFTADASGSTPQMASEYQIVGSQLVNSSRTVSACKNHRFKTGTTPPPLKIGYISPNGQEDYNRATLSSNLRPPKPKDPYSGARRIDTQGEYYATNNANEVPTLFSAIAKSILLRPSS